MNPRANSATEDKDRYSNPRYCKMMENFEKDMRCNTQKIREYLVLENTRMSVSSHPLARSFNRAFARS